MPLIDRHVPRDPGEPAWIVLGYAEPIERALADDANLERVVEAIASISATLAAMHARNIQHRDIKPENLFRYEGRWCIGDLGLVKLEHPAAITAPGEKIGPMFYIAPEMLNDAIVADASAADVFSVAKTLWKLASGQRYPLPGPMRRAERALTLSAYVNHDRARLLDSVLEVATRIDPAERMSMEDFGNELRGWLRPATIQSGDSAGDLATLALALQQANRPFVEREQDRVQSQRLRDADSLRIRELLKPAALDLQRALDSVGMKTSLAIDNYNWGFELNAHQVRAEVGARVTIARRDDLTVMLEASWVITDRGKPVLWKGTRTFIAGSSRESEEVAALMLKMKEQLPSALTAVVQVVRNQRVD